MKEGIKKEHCDMLLALIADLYAHEGAEPEVIDLSELSNQEKLHALVACCGSLIAACIRASSSDPQDAQRGVDAFSADIKRKVTEDNAVRLQ